jgi:hypothetical protein
MARDGGSLTVIDWFRSGDIALQDVATGSIRRLMIKRGTYLGDKTGETGMWTMLSPDRRRVAFLWEPGLVADERLEQGTHEPPQGGLHVVETTGHARSRLLVEMNEEIRQISAGAWAPDGRSMFVVLPGATAPIWPGWRLPMAQCSSCARLMNGSPKAG